MPRYGCAFCLAAGLFQCASKVRVDERVPGASGKMATDGLAKGDTKKWRQSLGEIVLAPCQCLAFTEDLETAIHIPPPT